MSGKRNLMAILVANRILIVAWFFAESERNVIHQRQAEGIAAAKAKGVKCGRHQWKKPADFPAVCAEWKKDALMEREAGKRLGVSHCTFLKRTKEISNECTILLPDTYIHNEKFDKPKAQYYNKRVVCNFR